MSSGVRWRPRRPPAGGCALRGAVRAADGAVVLGWCRRSVPNGVLRRGWAAGRLDLDSPGPDLVSTARSRRPAPFCGARGWPGPWSGSGLARPRACPPRPSAGGWGRAPACYGRLLVDGAAGRRLLASGAAPCMSSGRKLSLPLGRANVGDAPSVNPLLGGIVEDSHAAVNADSSGLWAKAPPY